MAQVVTPGLCVMTRVVFINNHVVKPTGTRCSELARSSMVDNGHGRILSMLFNRVDQPTEPDNSVPASENPALQPKDVMAEEDDQQSQSRPVSELSRPQPAAIDFAHSAEEDPVVNESTEKNAEKRNTMLSTASFTGEDPSAGNRSSRRASTMFNRLSQFVGNRSDGPSMRSSDRASFRQSGLFRSGFEDYDFEHHPFAEKRRKRDSKAVPKSWKFLGIVPPDMGDAVTAVTNKLRRSNFRDMYEKAKTKQARLRRSDRAQLIFKWTFYVILAATVYLLLVGMPLWPGGVWYLYAFCPLLINFEPTAPLPEADESGRAEPRDSDTALIIPCYKSEKLVGQTLQAALKIFPKQNIFVIANGNSPEPLDNTAEVCSQYDVSHTWSPLGSKIIAQFVGCYVARKFPYVLLIDDDCLLPPNLPIVSDRLKGNIKCIGYIMKSVGENGSLGTICQQAQDLEYKLCGLAKDFAGRVGSVTFPHGCIVLWDRELLVQTFQEHPGFSVSEDWFFGHAARQLGSRITMCTSTFVETETPSTVFFSSGGARGGFGEYVVGIRAETFS
ncbi:MAG: hypothetical protein Q9173_006324 [Seirophora scorigena]